MDREKREKRLHFQRIGRKAKERERSNGEKTFQRGECEGRVRCGGRRKRRKVRTSLSPDQPVKLKGIFQFSQQTSFPQKK